MTEPPPGIWDTEPVAEPPKFTVADLDRMFNEVLPAEPTNPLAKLQRCPTWSVSPDIYKALAQIGPKPDPTTGLLPVGPHRTAMFNVRLIRSELLAPGTIIGWRSTPVRTYQSYSTPAPDVVIVRFEKE